jgi:putative transposase
MSGKPRELYVDNAAEFKSEAPRRGCDENGIARRYRPPGQPHFGGIVQRLSAHEARTVARQRPRARPASPSGRIRLHSRPTSQPLLLPFRNVGSW